MKWRELWYVVALIALVYLCLSVVGCCPCNHIGTSTDMVDRDSVYVTHYDTLRIVQRDTMWLDRLEQSHDKEVSRRRHSELSNAYCVSTASVSDDGELTHTLDTRDSALLPARVVCRDRIVRDTIVRYRDRVEVRTELQQVKVSPWWVKPLSAVTAVLAVIVVWQNRKRILSIVSLWRI